MALLLTWPSAWPAEAPLTLDSLVRSSQHILVGKVLSTELISASAGDRTVDCGVGATIRVLENVIGSTPEIITAAFQVGPLAGKSYFLPLAATSNDPLSAAPRTKRASEADQARQLCQSKLPRLSAQQAAVIEIVHARGAPSDDPIQLEWLEVPTQLQIPGVAPSQLYEPVEDLPDLATTEGQLVPALFRSGARVISWLELRRQFCRLSPEMSRAPYCN
jgi:hypothetical protein